MFSHLRPYIPERKQLSGILFTFLFAGASLALAQLHFFRELSLSPLILAILLGVIYGNTAHAKMPESLHLGIHYSLKKILRLAIVFLGFRITFQEIGSIGSRGLLVDLVMVITTFILAVIVGRRWFGVDRDTAILVGAGSSICGASAVLATEGVLGSETYKAALAVATVTVFGTLGMFLYPVAYRAGLMVGLDETLFGIYAGGTIHEVAQVVAAGFGISETAGATATIVKLTRVMMLAPLLIILSMVLNKESTDGEKAPIPIPWFVFAFIAVSGFHSLHLLSDTAVIALHHFDTFLLATAMAALGIETNLNKIKHAGLRPIYLGLFLFIWLIIAGYGVTRGVDYLLT